LRVTYAAWLKRNGADDSEVAAGLGDKSKRKGTHYTRHVENEAKVIRAFTKVKARREQVFHPFCKTWGRGCKTFAGQGQIL
jgi:hypothetical protein